MIIFLILCFFIFTRKLVSRLGLQLGQNIQAIYGYRYGMLHQESFFLKLIMGQEVHLLSELQEPRIGLQYKPRPLFLNFAYKIKHLS